MRAEGESLMAEEGCGLELAHARPNTKEHAPHRFRSMACGELEIGELVQLIDGAKARTGLHQESRRIDDTLRSAGDGAERVGDEGRKLEPSLRRIRFISAVVFPPHRADLHSLSKTGLGDDIPESRGAGALLAQQAEGWIQPDLNCDHRSLCRTQIFWPDQEQWIASRADDEERLLEARIETREPLEIGEMFAVGIYNQG